MQVVKWFDSSEFERVGCNVSDIDPVALGRLSFARELAGIPFIITSAYRSPEHESARGRNVDGAHTRGVAFDIACRDSISRYLIVQSAIEAGFTRIGIASNFIHMDCAEHLPHPRIWLY